MSKRFIRLIAIIGVIAALTVLNYYFRLFNPIRLRVVGASETVIYDGQVHEAAGIEGADASGVVHVEGTDGRTYLISGLSTAGTATTPEDSLVQVGIVGEPQVMNDQGEDVTRFARIKRVPGSLTVEPRDVWLESPDLSKDFDGTPLTDKDGKLVREDGFVEGDGASYRFVGSQTVVGSSKNSFEVQLNPEVDESCYTIHKLEGTLEVRSRDEGDKLKAEVKGKGGKLKYDGTEHELRAVGKDPVRIKVNDVSYDVVGLDVETVKAKDVGEYESKISKGKNFGIYLSSDKNHKHNLADQFDLKLGSAKFTIGPADYYVATFFTSNSDWTDTVYISHDCETFYRVGTVPNKMRDPSIIYRDGLFWVVTCRNDADGFLWFEISASDDLVGWTSVGLNGPFTLASFPDVGGAAFNTVAPEWFQDEDGSLYIIVSCGWWGENHGRPTDDHMQAYLLPVSALYLSDGVPRMEVAGSAEKMSVNADGGDRIDGYIRRVGDEYYLTIKRNGLAAEVWKNDKVTAGGWKLVHETVLFGFEGFSIVPDGNEGYSMFADGVPDVAPYGVRRWHGPAMDGEWDARTLRFLDGAGGEIGAIRHGTVLGLDYEKDRAAWSVVDALY